MGKENINFLTLWIILGKIFVTFSSYPEATTSTVFGKSNLSVCLFYDSHYFHDSSAALTK